MIESMLLRMMITVGTSAELRLWAVIGVLRGLVFVLRWILRGWIMLLLLRLVRAVVQRVVGGKGCVERSSSVGAWIDGVRRIGDGWLGLRRRSELCFGVQGLEDGRATTPETGCRQVCCFFLSRLRVLVEAHGLLSMSQRMGEVSVSGEASEILWVGVSLGLLRRRRGEKRLCSRIHH